MMNAVDCYALDVGQGNACAFLLDRRRCVVIDAGPSGAVMDALLASLGAERVEVVVVTHNDADHSRGIGAILRRYHRTIGSIYFLQDRPVPEIRWLSELRASMGQRLRPLLKKFRRLETGEAAATIWRDGQTGASLQLLYPPFWDNLEAQRASKTNATSGILMFHIGERRILFCGDAPLSVWKQIHRDHGPLACDVLIVPHHGGLLGTATEGKTEAEQVDWLYSTAIQCSTAAVLSVGTDNPHKHPRKEVVRALVRAGVTPMCTEITPRCHDQVHALVPGVMTLPDYVMPPSRCGLQVGWSPRPTTAAHGCAGTVEIQLRGDQVLLPGMKRHQDAIDRLMKSGDAHVLCRP